MTVSTPKAELRARLRELTLRDERRLGRRLDKRGADLDRLEREVEEAERRVGRRRAAVPKVTYPAALPIAQRVEEIGAALRDHQVVVVAGETGSGKTTQLPKLCLELGRGVRGRIGHTQPRRLAARTVAERIAEELDSNVGDVVGYQTRFDQRHGEDTLVTVMTDGLLLAGIQSDPSLRAYDTIILDEAHERSLNIDFLIGYLARLLPRRPDLTVIITSATIDPERFSAHFGDAPIIEVSGRTYPVETRYREPAEDTDQVAAIADAVVELLTEPGSEGRSLGRSTPIAAGPQDILVFLSGEREIRDTADALAELDLHDTEILPLYARLASAQQRRVFQPHTGRRIVLATNVAETSLTVPGIRYVVDPGTARISRYSARLKVQRLPIEKISQASADQRAGRCGRLAEGVCIRLYSQEDHLARPRFTEPEILRTNLAAVLLQMAALRLGDVADFGFLDPPDARQVRDGVALLRELGALEGGDAQRLTADGRALARLPVDPRLGRMIIEAGRQACLDEVLVIAAALSIPDVRQRPAGPSGEQQAADAAHARFAHEGSDFLTLLNLWRYLREQQRERSSSAFRRMCRSEHLHYLRTREWQDLYSQLRRVALDLGLRRTDTPAEPAAVHRALLAGLLSQVGLRDGEKREYLGARGARFAIQPGSVLFKVNPQWVMAAELVETTRLWARTCARIDPAWVERLADHLVVRTHSEPHWSAKRGGAVASERVTLYGVPLVAGRTVDYGRIDPEHARELFVRHALVDGEWRTHHTFWEHNRRRLAEAAELEEKLRRRDVVVDEETLFAFYDERVPAHVVSVRHFDRWWKDARREQPDLLDLPDELLYGDADTSDFPDRWRQGDLELALSYRFDPGAGADGITVHVPLLMLNQVRDEGFDWLVPGLRTELVTELLRGLPKDHRRALVPVPETAAAVLARLSPERGPLLPALAAAVRAQAGIVIPRDVWRPDRLPSHLRVTFAVEDGGHEVGRDPSLSSLQRRLAPTLRAALATASGIERTGLTTFDMDELPRVVTGRRGHVELRAHPALVDEGDRVAVRVFASEAEQRRALWAGTRRLLQLGAGSPLAQVTRHLDTSTKLALAGNPHGGVPALLDDALVCALDDLLLRHGGPVRTRQEFTRLAAAVHADLVDRLLELLRVTATILRSAGEIGERLAELDKPALEDSIADLRTQLAGLVHPGFLAAKSAKRLPDVARYLQAMRRRLEVLVRDAARDRQRMAVIHELQRAHRDTLNRLPAARRAQARELPWMIEELRVSEFAQELGTAYRISPERVWRALRELLTPV